MKTQIPSESDLTMHGWWPYSEIHQERIRAHRKFENPPISRSQEMLDWDHPSWLRVVMEELGEVAEVLNDMELGKFSANVVDQGLNALEAELVQTAAMVCAWLDAVRRGR